MKEFKRPGSEASSGMTMRGILSSAQISVGVSSCAVNERSCLSVGSVYVVLLDVEVVLIGVGGLRV